MRSHYLNQHPESIVPKIKEPGHFVKEELLRASRRDPGRHELFDESILESDDCYRLFKDEDRLTTKRHS